MRSFETKVKFIVILLGAGVVVHLSLGFFGAIILNRNGEQRHSRLRPRYSLETVVKGKTYHTHPKAPVDLVVQENYARRRRQIENIRPHFVARRGILAHDSDDTTMKPDNRASGKLYKEVGGEIRNLGLKCGSCAVVGSAGTLTTAKSGTQIDSADCVFRFGLAPVNGFEEDVGSRTDVRVVDGKSFEDIVRYPKKLSTGNTASPTWIVFEHFDVDAMTKLLFKLPQIKRANATTKILTSTRKGETVAFYSMKREAAKLGYTLPNKKPSTLWFTMQAVEQAGCQKVDVFGIPDPKYCKTWHDGLNAKSRYWGKGSPNFCTSGTDSGLDTESAALAQLVTISDRRALLALANTKNPSMKISFHAPQWPQMKSAQNV